ncbi:MAG TPA: RNA polymerase sigma factor SigZ [Spirochaetes bacterium]|nr:RNA polymerase sigma factor SigZ [Spirochaetota bacterium]
MEAIESIWEQYHHKLHLFIQKRVSDSFAADDILQEVFLKVLTKIDSLKDSDKLQGWVYQIARNAIIDYYRSHAPLEPPDNLIAIESSPSDKARQEIISCLEPMIRCLPEPYREAIILSDIEGRTQKEIAEKANLSLSGAKSRVQRARTMMKAMLLDCCQFEFDHQGRMVDYSRKEKDDGDC